MLIAELVVPDKTKRDNLINYLKTQIALHSVWKERLDEEQAMYFHSDPETGAIEIGVKLWVRFVNIASKDDIFTKAKTWLQGNTEVTGSIRYHVCDHDETPCSPCVETVLWSR